MQKLSSKSPRGGAEKYMYNSVDANVALGLGFHHVQDKRNELNPGLFFNCKHSKGFEYTQGWVHPGLKLTLGLKFSCKQCLIHFKLELVQATIAENPFRRRMFFRNTVFLMH